MNLVSVPHGAGRRGSPGRALRLLAGLLVLSSAFPSWAACTVTAQAVQFGDYVSFDAVPADGVGNISVTCDEATPYTLSLGPGSGSQTARTMRGAGSVLAYNLYVDAGHDSIWGDGAGGTATVSGNALSESHPVYGRIAARQNAPVGPYTDAIVVTLDY